MLKGQDILVLLKLVSRNDNQPPFSVLAVELGMSPSEVYQAVQRATKCGLMQVDTTVQGSHLKSPNKVALLEFLIHGIKYVFPALRGMETRGVPTCLHAPGLKKLVSNRNDPIPVWPWAEGSVRGFEYKPLYRAVPNAALADRNLHQLLGLIDAIRSGRARERAIAIDDLTRRLG